MQKIIQIRETRIRRIGEQDRAPVQEITGRSVYRAWIFCYFFINEKSNMCDFLFNRTTHYFPELKQERSPGGDAKIALTLKGGKRNIQNLDRISSTFPIVEKWSKRLVSFQAVH